MKDSDADSWLRKLPEGGNDVGSKVKMVPLILVQISDDPVGQVAVRIAQSVEAIMAAEGTVFHIISAIVIGTFDFGHAVQTENDDRCEATAFAVHNILAANGKIIYGRCGVIYGNFGSPTRMQYGPFIPRIGDLLHELRGLEFGAIHKLE